MSQGALKYPIQQFLRRLIPPFESSRSEFVRKPGYQDLEPGRLHLDAWLDRGEGYEGFLRQISATYPHHAAEVERALATTADMKAVEGDPGWRERCKNEDASFVPYIHVQGEQSVPNGITICGLSGGHERWTTIRIPKTILNLPIEEQMLALPELMRAYLVEYKGACPFFGMATSFLYVRFRGYYRFDKDCGFIEYVKKPFRRGRVGASLR